MDEIVKGECNFLSSVSLQQKFEMADQGYSLVTAQFYLASKGKYILELWGWSDPQEEPRLNFGSFFYVFFSSPLPYVNWDSQEGCLFHLRFSLWSSEFLLFHFRRLFFSLSFSHCHFGLLFPILTTYQDHDDPEAGHHGGLSAADSEGAGPAMWGLPPARACTSSVSRLREGILPKPN